MVIKLGARGCYVKPAAGEGFYSPALSTEAVDTTGAGDAFVAGFLAGVLRGQDLPACARLACAVAALNIRKVGATAGMPSMEEALSFMKSQGRAG